MPQGVSWLLPEIALILMTAVATHLVMSFAQTLMHYKLGHHPIGGKFFRNHIRIQVKRKLSRCRQRRYPTLSPLVPRPLRMSASRRRWQGATQFCVQTLKQICEGLPEGESQYGGESPVWDALVTSTMSQAVEPAKLALACQGHTQYLEADSQSLPVFLGIFAVKRSFGVCGI